MADWEEIKRLAADLQRAQLSGSAQRYVIFLTFNLMKHCASCVWQRVWLYAYRTAIAQSGRSCQPSPTAHTSAV